MHRHHISPDDWTSGIWPIFDMLHNGVTEEFDILLLKEAEKKGISPADLASEDAKQADNYGPMNDDHAHYADFAQKRVREWILNTMMGASLEKKIRQDWLDLKKPKSEAKVRVEAKGEQHHHHDHHSHSQQASGLESIMLPTPNPIKVEYEANSKGEATSSNVDSITMSVRVEQYHVMLKRLAYERELQKKSTEYDKKVAALEAMDPKREDSGSERMHWKRIKQWEMEKDALFNKELTSQWNQITHQLAVYRRCMWKIRQAIALEASEMKVKSLSQERQVEISDQLVEREGQLGKFRKCACDYVCECDYDWMDASKNKDELIV